MVSIFESEGNTMQKMRANSVDMLNGPLLPNIWVFSVPLMLTNLLQMLFQAADTVVVGRFAGQGIGKGIALCLAKRGVKVVATGRRLEPIEQTIKEIKEFGGEGFAMSCDSADRARVEEVVKATVEAYGTVDVVVNNGQAIVPSALVEETSYDNMLKAWESGVIGSLNYMQAAFPYMKEQHEGRIINFASATGMFGIAGQLAYGSNKEALRGLTKIAAKEWGQYGICVNVVLPGAESPAAKAWAEKFPEEYAKQVELNPMKRFGDSETDIAPVVAFLAGPDSCYFSGQSVIVDGANSIMP